MPVAEGPPAGDRAEGVSGRVCPAGAAPPKLDIDATGIAAVLAGRRALPRDEVLYRQIAHTVRGPPSPPPPTPPNHPPHHAQHTHPPTHQRTRCLGWRSGCGGREVERSGAAPLQDEERAARAAVIAPNEAAAAATKAASGRTSKHHNVSWSSSNNEWHAQAKHRSTTIHLGFFADQDDAGRAVDKWTRKKYKEGDPRRKLNFDSDGELAERHSTDSSKYCGVYKDKRSGKWLARIKHGTLEYIGTFATEKAAAEAYDAKALKLGKPTNFDQYGACNPEVDGKVVPQHDKADGRHNGLPPRPHGRR